MTPLDYIILYLLCGFVLFLYAALVEENDFDTIPGFEKVKALVACLTLWPWILFEYFKHKWNKRKSNDLP